MKRTLFLLALFLLLAQSLHAEDWPRFRGPRGDGVSGESTLPLKWGPKENIAWKVELPGPGSSSPIVLGQRVFVTCFTGKVADGAGPPRHVLRPRGGKLLWKNSYPAPQPENGLHRPPAPARLHHQHADHRRRAPLRPLRPRRRPRLRPGRQAPLARIGRQDRQHASAPASSPILLRRQAHRQRHRGARAPSSPSTSTPASACGRRPSTATAGPRPPSPICPAASRS